MDEKSLNNAAHTEPPRAQPGPIFLLSGWNSLESVKSVNLSDTPTFQYHGLAHNASLSVNTILVHPNEG
jgi:hypothetical protein